MKRVKQALMRAQIALKLVPDFDGKPAIAQRVGINFKDVVVKGVWAGAARLKLSASVDCPFADLPICRFADLPVHEICGRGTS